jgi:hypothetical protein
MLAAKELLRNSECHVWMAPALQDFFDQICAFVRSSHVSGLFARFIKMR